MHVLAKVEKCPECSRKARRRREDETVQLRKAKRDEQLTKKRLMRDDAEDAENEPAVNANLPFAFNPKDRPISPDMIAAAAKLKDPSTDMPTRLAVLTEVRKQLSRASKPPIQEAINAGIYVFSNFYSNFWHLLANFWQTLRGSFSAVSKPIFAKYSFEL